MDENSVLSEKSILLLGVAHNVEKANNDYKEKNISISLKLKIYTSAGEFTGCPRIFSEDEINASDIWIDRDIKIAKDIKESKSNLQIRPEGLLYIKNLDMNHFQSHGHSITNDGDVITLYDVKFISNDGSQRILPCIMIFADAVIGFMVTF